MDIVAFAQSTEGLIASIGGLLTGLAAILNSFRQFRHSQKMNKEIDTPAEKGCSHFITFTALAGASLLILSCALLLTRAFSAEKNALNVELTTAAFEAFNNGNFERAIANAEKCIAEFDGAANREQASLEKLKAPLPPTGSVEDVEKSAILERGLLNDVATCYYIKGRSAENLGLVDKARQAYEAASKYTYARCWDPKGWFWSPAEASQNRLAKLK